MKPIHWSYLRNLVKSDDISHVVGDLIAESSNDSHQIFPATFIVGNKLLWFEEQVHSVPVGHLCIKITVVDLESKRDVGQDFGILMDFMEGEHQSQDMLVVLC